jgi:Prolyl oligopeptidase family
MMMRFLLLLPCLAGGLLGQEPKDLDFPDLKTAPAAKSDWKGFVRLNFSLDGRPSWLVLPAQAAAGRPWIWRTEFFGHEPQADLALLKLGFHVAYTTMTNQYGAPVAIDHMQRFHDLMEQQHQLATKVVLEGFSRGGLFALNYATIVPHRVACLYLDAPVCDFRSWPGGFKSGKGSPTDWARCKQVYGFANDEAAKRYAYNPVDNLMPLIPAKIAILSVVGDADDVVPVAENSGLLKDRFVKMGGKMEMIVKPGVKHHPHSLVDPQPIVDFVLKWTKPKAG